MLRYLRKILTFVFYLFGYKIIKSEKEIEKDRRKNNIKKYGVMADIAITGPYILHNFGDDLIGSVLAASLSRHGYRCSIPGLGLSNSEWLKVVPHRDIKTAINKSSFVLIGGGHIFGEGGPRKHNTYRQMALATVKLASNQGKKAAITAIGAGPISDRTGVDLVQETCAKVQFVGVRDNESAEFLISDVGVPQHKIRVGADLALLWPEYLNITTRPNNFIGIQFDPSMYIEKARSERILQYISSIINQKPGHIAFISNGNYNTSIKGYCDVLSPNINYLFMPDFLRDLSGLRAVFTSHLHIAIAAYACRIPCFSVYVREKTKRFYEQIGRPERAIDINKIDVCDLDGIFQVLNTVTWEEYDENRLAHLKEEARKLIDFESMGLIGERVASLSSVAG